SWSSGANGMIQGVPSGASDKLGTHMYYRYQNGTAYPWKPADFATANVCQLNVTADGTTTPAVTSGLAPATATPPATIVSLASTGSDASDTPVLPPADIGISAALLQELLPNPTDTGS